MEKRKVLGTILMISSIFMFNVTWMLAQIARYMDKLTGEFIVNISYMPVLSFVSIGAVFVFGLYIFFKKE